MKWGTAACNSVVITNAPSAEMEPNRARSAAPAPTPRIESVDLLRGIIMVVMALDHTRDFFHAGAIAGQNPLDLTSTTPILFFTRWITHFCAPNFSFLAGTGVFLAASRGKPKGELAWFLLTRGAWLIFLELTLLMWFGWDFEVHLTRFTFATLWALGWSMIVLSALVRLPVWAITTFGLALVVGHNALDRITPASFGENAWIWNVLHVSGKFTTTHFSFEAFYPLIPWIGVMAAGYGLGSVYRWEAEARKRFLLRLGVGAVVAFVVLRFSNVYGNLLPWTQQSTALFTVLSFLDCTKYPPSLCYLLMTIGPGLIALSLLERPTPRIMRPFLVYGRVPFFYYVLHIPLIHALAVIVHWLTGLGAGGLHKNLGPVPPDTGFGLPIVYLVWICVVVGLYPACRWFADLKRRRREAWLSYL